MSNVRLLFTFSFNYLIHACNNPTQYRVVVYVFFLWWYTRRELHQRDRGACIWCIKVLRMCLNARGDLKQQDSDPGEQTGSWGFMDGCMDWRRNVVTLHIKHRKGAHQILNNEHYRHNTALCSLFVLLSGLLSLHKCLFSLTVRNFTPTACLKEYFLLQGKVLYVGASAYPCIWVLRVLYIRMIRTSSKYNTCYRISESSGTRCANNESFAKPEKRVMLMWWQLRIIRPHTFDHEVKYNYLLYSLIMSPNISESTVLIIGRF